MSRPAASGFKDDVPARPAEDLLEAQAEWLAPVRTGLLRRAAVARRKSVLDLGAGVGLVTEELARRCGGRVVALDRDYTALAGQRLNAIDRVTARAESLPFKNGSFDLVFSQCSLMWMEARTALEEIYRILDENGVLAAIEPDYGGMIEHPEEIAVKDIWISGLTRAGAEPSLGRRLPELLAGVGFKWQVNLLDRLYPPHQTRFDLLAGLPLTAQEKEILAEARKADALMPADRPKVAHLPFFAVLAVKT